MCTVHIRMATLDDCCTRFLLHNRNSRPDLISHQSKGQTVNVFLHDLRSNQLWSGAPLTSTHQLSAHLHEAFITVCPTKPRMNVARQQCAMQQIVAFDRRVKQKYGSRMKHISQSSLCTQKGKGCIDELGILIARQSVLADCGVQDVFHPN